MILLTKLNGTPFTLNCDLIETIEENPDTTIRLIGKNFFLVKETMQQVIDKVIAFRRETCDIRSKIIPEYYKGKDTIK